MDLFMVALLTSAAAALLAERAGLGEAVFEALREDACGDADDVERRWLGVGATSWLVGAATGGAAAAILMVA